jgi:hypothetical protein
MTHLLLERLALQREDVLKAQARASRPAEVPQPRTRRTAKRRRFRRPAWSPW